MAKQIIYSEEARASLQRGVGALSRAVATTLGPKGRNVAIAQSFGGPTVTHDGLTVAKGVELEDPFENMGVELVREAASKTNDKAGDGRTTSIVLAQAIIDEGLKNVAAGVNPMQLRAGISEAAREVVEELKNIKKDVTTREEKEQVATISSSDNEIGKLIADAFEKVGDEGIITVEESRGLEFEIDYREGMQFDRGYVSAYFVTDSSRMESAIEDPHILITDKKISAINDLLPMLENLVKVTKNFVIISEDIEGEALATLVVNRLRGTFNVLAVKAPGFGDRRKAMLEDIAVLTGAQVISEELGRKLDSVTIDDLGRADRIVSTKDETIIVGGKGQREAIEARVAQIKVQADQTESDYDREKLEERVAKLSGGVAVLGVGAATETEMKEKKARVEDAKEATRAAIQEGIVPGGGVALLRARKVLEEAMNRGDEKAVAYRIVYKALEAPVRQLASNAGFDAGWVVREVDNKESDTGFNVMTGEFTSMLGNGILDPVRVTRTAVENAASVAINILTTEALIADIKDESADAGVPAGMGGMPGMM